MHRSGRLGLAVFVVGLITASSTGSALAGSYNQPRWWAKYQALLNHTAPLSVTSPLSVGANVDASNEDGPQSETSIAIDPSNPKQVVGGSNEIFRLPMRGYFSKDGGKTFGAVDLPLPPPATTNGADFGSDPGVAFDTHGNVYYSYIVVFWNRTFASIQGTEMAVAKSFDGGATWPQVTYFNFNSGGGKFNDKPMIAVDTNPASLYRDSVYVAWDDRRYVVSDQFNQWLAVDPVTGAVDLSWTDPRNDPADTKTDTYATASTNGGASFATNVKVTSATSDESAANPDTDAGDQYGDYEGLAAFGGIARSLWTDGRFDGAVDPATGQTLGEEVFTAATTVK